MKVQRRRKLTLCPKDGASFTLTSKDMISLSKRKQASRMQYKMNAPLTLIFKDDNEGEFCKFRPVTLVMKKHR